MEQMTMLMRKESEEKRNRETNKKLHPKAQIILYRNLRKECDIDFNNHYDPHLYFNSLYWQWYLANWYQQ